MGITTAITTVTTAPKNVHWRAIGLFVAVAMGSAFALDAVCAATGGLGTPQGKLILVTRMFSPALASWVVCRFVTGASWLRAVGLRRGSPRSGNRRRILTSALIGILVVMAVTAAYLALAITVGWFHPDWAMTEQMEKLAALGSSKPLPPAHIFFILTVVQCLVAGCTINALAALGEETGWRGWLLSALSPLGTTRAVVFTGAVWGLWHAPLIAMGYEYEHQIPAALGIVLFTMFCMAFGTLLAWLRARSGSIWPAAITHGTLNAFATLPPILVAPEDSWDLVTSSIAGVPAVLMIMAIAAVLLSRQRIELTSGTRPEALDNMT